MPNNCLPLVDQRKLLIEHWFQARELAEGFRKLMSPKTTVEANEVQPPIKRDREISKLLTTANNLIDKSQKVNKQVICLFEPEILEFIKKTPPKANTEVLDYLKQLKESVPRQIARVVSRIASSIQNLTSEQYRQNLTFGNLNILELKKIQNESFESKTAGEKIGDQGQYFLEHLRAQTSAS